MPMESKEYHIIGFKTTCISAHSMLKLKILDQVRKKINSLWDTSRFYLRASVISTLLINDVPNSSSRFSYRIFTDDTNIFFK